MVDEVQRVRFETHSVSQAFTRGVPTELTDVDGRSSFPRNGVRHQYLTSTESSILISHSHTSRITQPSAFSIKALHTPRPSGNELPFVFLLRRVQKLA